MSVHRCEVMRISCHAVDGNERREQRLARPRRLLESVPLALQRFGVSFRQDDFGAVELDLTQVDGIVGPVDH